MTQPDSEAAANLEEALAAIERAADATLKALGVAAKEAKKVKSAAAAGQMRDLQSALSAVARLADDAASSAGALREGWRFDVADWFASGEYAKELLASAAEAGVQAFESDDRILSYPVVVALSPADATVLVDRTRDRKVRPSVLVRQLGILQERPPKFKPQPFLASLAAAYDLAIAAKGSRPDAPATLVDVHRVLTLLPGSAREYTRQEFARDLYLLDQTGVVDTADGRRLTLPASALTRGSATLTTVTRAGQRKVYAGIAFVGIS